MAAATATRPPRIQPSRHELQHMLHAGMRSICEWGVYRRTLRELSELSGRELVDLGLHRSEIRRVAHDAVYGARR